MAKGAHYPREAGCPFQSSLGSRFTEGVQAVIDGCGVPWSVVQLGARAEYRFRDPAPVNGGQSAAAGDDQLDDYLHVYLHNRGVLMTPFTTWP